MYKRQRARSVAGAEQVRARYAHEPWMTDRLARSIELQLAWDGLRHAQHHRDPLGVLRSLRELRLAPSTAPVLRQMLQHRRRARRFTAAGAGA